jgi:hypothetical protein
MKPPSKMTVTEARVARTHAKLLSALPPEMSAKLDQTELTNGVAISNKEDIPDKAVILSPGDGMYSWNGSHVTESEILKKIGIWRGCRCPSDRGF